jgi:pyridinium-3,5-bisthiocarboxylic acid mononucleotide nickel chelatase
MSLLYLDLLSGISGDMFLGALLDLGVALSALERELEKLGLRDYHLHAARGQRSGISGVKFDVHLESDHHHHAHSGSDHDHSHDHVHGHDQSHGHEHSHSAAGHSHGRTFSEIREMIERSPLSEWVKGKSLAVFQRVAEAEGKIHGQPPEQVHFHEVGAVDSIVDIVGAAIALELLGKPRVLAAPVVDGTGWVTCAHGRFPVPAPATLEILGVRGIAVSQCDEPHELITPTGAALLAEFAETFGPMRHLSLRKIGYGLGQREHTTRPNVLRVLLCEETPSQPVHDWETDIVAVLQTNLDDVSAEILGRFMEKALAAGALDVFHTPIQMKKSRPGTLLTLLCAEGDADRLAELVLRETTAFGVRCHTAGRRKLRREFKEVATSYGPVTVKIGILDGAVLQTAPEFESCKQLADAKNVPLKAIYEAAQRAASGI